VSSTESGSGRTAAAVAAVYVAVAVAAVAAAVAVVAAAAAVVAVVAVVFGDYGCGDSSVAGMGLVDEGDALHGNTDNRPEPEPENENELKRPDPCCASHSPSRP
jgi:opacity protein-like surface antigen